MTSIARAVIVGWLVAACGSTAPAPAPQTTAPAAPAAPTDVDPETRDQPVTDADLAILRRADEILASAAVWNRLDTRECPADATTWSLYCALERASIEVLGEYQHRRVALQEVRFAIEEATRGIDLAHRMMDYNNLPSTRFEDIKRMLAIATDRVRARLAAPLPAAAP